MTWQPLHDLTQLETLRAQSFENPVLIYKHSSTCSISSTALNRLERNWQETDMAPVQAYFLDLLRNRPVSNAVSAEFGIPHESPQVLILRNGECVYDASHLGINYPALKNQLSD